MISFIKFLEMIAYHGTPGKEFDSFNDKLIGKNKQTSLSPLGIFFAPSEEEASPYIWSPMSRGVGTIMKWELDIKNPYKMPFQEFNDLIDWGSLGKQKYKTKKDARNATIKRRQELIEAGHDGVFIYNYQGELAEIVIFHASQAKRIKDTEPS